MYQMIHKVYFVSLQCFRKNGTFIIVLKSSRGQCICVIGKYART